ncbi:MAG: helix-hairpin-helix domain-containing protein [Chloroflexota bacterium]
MSARQLAWVAGAFVVALALGAMATLLAMPSPAGVIVDTREPGPALVTDETLEGSAVDAARLPARSDPVMLVIDVEGAVVRPGLVRVPAGARVADVLELAGGFGPGADLAATATMLNLAQEVTDGSKVVVPAIGGGPGDPGAPDAGIASDATGPVDLNRATEAELDALPGVGPATIARIVAARAEAPFASVDELRSPGHRGRGDARQAARPGHRGPLTEARPMSLPRSGWMAMGAVGCGLAAVSAPSSGTPPMAMALACATLVAGVLALARRTTAAAVALGMATVLARLLVGGVAAGPVAPPPTARVEGTWVADVLTLGSTEGGQQRSTLLVRAADLATAAAGATGPWRTYAWLPRYPALVPGDRIAFDDAIEPTRHDGSGFADYLDGIGVVATTRVGRSSSWATRAGPVRAARRSDGSRTSRSRARGAGPMAGLASAILVGRRDRVA